MNSNNKLTRRDALVTGVALAASVSMSSTNYAESPKESGLIDAHSHIWGRDLEKFPLSNGKTLADLAPPSFTAEELLDTCQPLGIERVVLIQHSIYHGWDNRYLIHEAARMPDRFRVVGMVDDTQPHPDVLCEKLLADRVTGFRITSGIRGKDKWLTGPGMNAMWKMGAKTGQAMCCLINPDDLPAVSHMCQHHPDTNVVIDHFARVGIDGEIRESDLNQLCALAKYPHVHVKVSAYYALGKKKPPYLDLLPMIRRVVDAFGPERTMWASDAPYQVVDGHSYKASVELIRDHADFLSASDKEWLFRKTAEKVFFFV
ncbi:MAG: amidohydrolase family protein [Planctomycetaceae bacterium]